MISPGNMKIIQVDITNHCIHHCSNCTRFCGLHEKKFMMGLQDFQKAVDSLAEFPGIVGVMGGEPTLNPQFPQMVDYLRNVRAAGRPINVLRTPVRDFNVFHHEHWNNLYEAKRGLWSALGQKYYENLELISDVFPYQCLNDHKNTGLHQALLLPRKELGISDEEWIPLRDKCWIQNEWSASITPKGAFFCEIAAALDWLLDGPGGWPVEPGWWKRTPDEFGDQLKWCEYCSAPLAVPRIAGNAETDIISPAIWEKLKDRKAWKITQNHYQIFDVAHYDKAKYSLNYNGEPYLTAGDKRVSQDTGSTLFPHNIAVWRTSPDVTVPLRQKFCEISAADAKAMKFQDWLLIANRDIPVQTLDFMTSAVFNLGVLYMAPDGSFILLNRRASALHGVCELPEYPVLKNFYPRVKRYIWRNFRTPEKETVWMRAERFYCRLRDSFVYRRGLLLQLLHLEKTGHK